MPPKHKQQEREEWQVNQQREYECSHCRDTGRCRQCQGRGCMECSYTGVCPHCSDIRHQFVEGLA